VIEPAPSLGGGGGGSVMQMLLLVVGSLGSVATMGRSGPMVTIGVSLLGLTPLASIGGMLTFCGKDSTNQRTGHLERMRDDFSREERKARTHASELNPPPDALRGPDRSLAAGAHRGIPRAGGCHGAGSRRPCDRDGDPLCQLIRRRLSNSG